VLGLALLLIGVAGLVAARHASLPRLDYFQFKLGSGCRFQPGKGLLTIASTTGCYCGGCPFDAETPPSTATFAPVMKLASSLAREAMTAATSEDTQTRPSGIRSEFLQQALVVHHVGGHARCASGSGRRS
jgi:hypothetical protein